MGEPSSLMMAMSPGSVHCGQHIFNKKTLWMVGMPLAMGSYVVAVVVLRNRYDRR